MAGGIRVAVTGGAGHLGTLLLRGLCREPDVAQVRCLDLRPPLIASDKLEVVSADVRDPQFARHLEGMDALVHLAFVVTRHLPRDRYEAINVGGSRNVFNAAAAAGVQTIVYASSVAAYGVVPGHPVPLLESSEREFQPGFAYSACKWLVEDLLDAFEEDHPNIAVARMRPSILLGRYMDQPLGRILRGRRMVSLGHENPLPIVWEEDVADAFVLALMQRARGAFNLSADSGLDPERLALAGGLRLIRVPSGVAREAMRLTKALARLGLSDAVDPAWTEATARSHLEPSSARARSELGWSPRCPTAADVIRRYVRVVPHRMGPRFVAAMNALALLEPGRVRAVLPAGARIHLEIEGPRGGDFGVTVADGRLRVSREAPRPPTARVIVDAVDLGRLLSGTVSFEQGRREGRIEVEGDEAVAGGFGALLAGLRQSEGLRGVILDRVGRLLAR